MTRSTLALMLLLATASTGYAQTTATPRLHFHPWSVALTPRLPVDHTSMSNVAVGGEALLSLTTRTQLVGSGFVAVGVVTRSDRRRQARLYQVELGARRILPAIRLGVRRIRPFVGAGMSERLYDLVTPGFPDGTRFGGYVSAGIDLAIAGSRLTVESRSHLFEGGPTGHGRTVAAQLVDAMALGVHVVVP